jgi:hypothetical protein
MLWRMLSRLETCLVYCCIWSVALAKSIVPRKTWRKLWHSYISKMFLTKILFHQSLDWFAWYIIFHIDPCNGVHCTSNTSLLNIECFTCTFIIETVYHLIWTKKFMRITSGFGGGEFTKMLRKVCTCQKLKFVFLLLEYCKIRECYAVANAFTIRNMFCLL